MNTFYRRGNLIISKDFYESDDINIVLQSLQIKVYRIEYLPFNGCYDLLITSPYLPIINNCVEVPKYNIVIDNGLKFVKAEYKDFGIFNFKEDK